MTHNRPKVLVSGTGLATPLGSGTQFVEALRQGKSAVAVFERFDTSFSRCSVAGVLKDFKPRPGDTRLAAILEKACRDALAAGGLDSARVDPDRAAVALSCSKGGMEIFDGAGPNVETFFEEFPTWVPGMRFRQKIGWRAGSLNFPLACATGAFSIAHSAERISYGELDCALAGAAEASLTPLVWSSFDRLGALAACGSSVDHFRGAFDEDAAGFVLGEGGAALLLESEKTASNRGQAVKIELAAWACNADAWHLTAPAPRGESAELCLRLALSRAAVSPDEVDYLNAHGTGTRAGDDAELAALQAVFLNRKKPLPFSSIKSATGHLLGAAGGVEAAAAVMALTHGFIPASLQVRKARQAQGLRLVHKSEAAPRMRVAVSLSLGFGGHNVALVFKRIK